MGFAKRNDRAVVGEVERHAFGIVRYAGIAGRAKKPIGEGARRHFPGERVLSPAGAEKQNIHLDPCRRPSSTAKPVRTSKARDLAALTRQAPTDYCGLVLQGLRPASRAAT